MNVKYIHENTDLTKGLSGNLLAGSLFDPDNNAVSGRNDQSLFLRGRPFRIAKKPGDEKKKHEEEQRDNLEARQKDDNGNNQRTSNEGKALTDYAFAVLLLF
jgi:hypothetical protein